jgi:hypothetical protein
VVIEIQEYTKDDNCNNNKPAEHVSQQDQSTGYGKQQYPADMQRA